MVVAAIVRGFVNEEVAPSVGVAPTRLRSSSRCEVGGESEPTSDDGTDDGKES